MRPGFCYALVTVTRCKVAFAVRMQTLYLCLSNNHDVRAYFLAYC